MEWIKEKLEVEIEFPIIADERGEIAEIQRNMKILTGGFVIEKSKVILKKP